MLPFKNSLFLPARRTTAPVENISLHSGPFLVPSTELSAWLPRTTRQRAAWQCSCLLLIGKLRLHGFIWRTRFSTCEEFPNPTRSIGTLYQSLMPILSRSCPLFLAAPRGKDPYAEIRSMLCQTYEPKREQKLDALLSATDLGDERPAEFALELKRLLDNASSEEILKRIFFRCLPRRLKDVVSACSDESFDGLAAVADRAWARDSAMETAVTVVQAANPHVSPTSSSSMVSTTTVNPPARGRGRRQRGGARQPRQESRSIVLCPFHVKWGGFGETLPPDLFALESGQQASIPGRGRRN